jgi:L-seryl-tRNA(Ser) seleniumtransferase
VVADIGSGLLDANVPWLHGPPPAWLVGEPAAVQSLADGADLVTFSGDKLLGGPQAGIIAGNADLVARCKAHPLARALRPGGLVLEALQEIALTYLDGRARHDIAFWRMVDRSADDLHAAAGALRGELVERHGVDPDHVSVSSMDALPGAGSAPGVTMPSAGLVVAGDHLAALRAHDPPVIARSRDGATSLDLRAVDPSDHDVIIDAVRVALTAAPTDSAPTSS